MKTIPLWFLLLCSFPVAAAPVLKVCDGGKSRLSLEADETFVRTQVLGPAVEDFQRCYRSVTGQVLPRQGKTTLLLDPGTSQGVRLQASVTALQDASNNSSENGTVMLVLTPTREIPGHPLAAAGEKAVWTCTWERAARQLQFALTIGNGPFYGPGYGPFTFATLQAPAPVFDAGATVDLCLELRAAGGQDLRGGYRIDGSPWVYTAWMNPTRAGMDTREPGKSDRNGPQAWQANWPGAWSGHTTATIAAYGAQQRQVRVVVRDVAIRQEQQELQSLVWEEGPAQGHARVDQGSLELTPSSDGWNTVGKKAAQLARMAGIPVPLRLKLMPWPAGRTRFDPALMQGWRREVTPQSVTLLGWSGLGLQNALYGLLDEWGCRWVMPGDLGECLPRRSMLGLAVGSTRFTPAADFSVEPNGSNDPYGRFFARNQGGWRHWLPAMHYWLYALPPEKYFATHPEWYSLVDGKRQPLQLCTSNPEVVAQMTAVARQYLRDNPNVVSFPMDPMDNLDFCQCANCRALDVPGYRDHGVPVMTDRVLHFANAIAGNLRQEFPDRYVALYVYASHWALPRREKPLPNIMLGVTRDHHCLLHLNPTAVCPGSDFHQFLRQWLKVAPNLFAYQYDPISWTGNLPCPNYLEMGQSLRTMLRDLHLRGSYSDYGVLPAGYAGTFLNRYIPQRIKVNPQLRPEVVLHDACAAFFGPAAAAMEAHYLAMAKAAGRPHPGLRGIGFGITFYDRIFWPEQIHQARLWLNRARQQAQGHQPYHERVEMVNLAQDYLEAWLDGVWSARRHQYPRTLQAFDRMDAKLAQLAAHKWADATDAPVRALMMRRKTLAQYFPRELGYVTQWKILGPFSNQDLKAAGRKERFEPVAGMEKPVALQGGRSASWWSYTSPGGYLNLEQAVRPRAPHQELMYAFAGTTITAPRAMAARLLCDSFYPYRIYLNGQELFYRAGLNADLPDRTALDVRLQPGPNTIIFKSAQTVEGGDSFPWGLYLRVVPDNAVEVAPLPEKWLFQKDPENVGQPSRWYESAFDDSTWQALPVNQPWENSIGPYDGFGWYRCSVQLPAVLPEKRLALRFGGVDEEAWVYVNGQLVGEHSVASTGKTIDQLWQEAFTVEVPRQVLKPGAGNSIAVRVHDSAYAGGIYQGVKLVVLP